MNRKVNIHLLLLLSFTHLSYFSLTQQILYSFVHCIPVLKEKKNTIIKKKKSFQNGNFNDPDLTWLSEEELDDSKYLKELCKAMQGVVFPHYVS